MATVIFFHGLNTFGDDLLHIGPLTFGPMHGPLERQFAERDIPFIGVTGLGFGTPEEQAEKAIAFLDETGLLDQEVPGDQGSLHLLGHSVGGLVARALAARPEVKGRIRSIITMGTPHHGAWVATFGMQFEKRHPWLCRAAALAGYDTRVKAAVFKNFTIEAAREFNARHPSAPGVREISILCEAERNELSLPYRLFYERMHPRFQDPQFPKSDGFIWSESQKRGDVIGPFALDHFGELGFFFQLGPAGRRKARAEFQRLVNTLGDLVSN
jgi:pimeloyl-ACP methyl ester carboxylesterase